MFRCLPGVVNALMNLKPRSIYTATERWLPPACCHAFSSPRTCDCAGILSSSSTLLLTSTWCQSINGPSALQDAAGRKPSMKCRDQTRCMYKLERSSVGSCGTTKYNSPL